MVIYTHHRGKPIIVEDVSNRNSHVNFSNNLSEGNGTIKECFQAYAPIIDWTVPSCNYFIEVPQKRKSTDVAFLFAFAVSVGVLLGLIIYSFNNSDFRRLTNGYDICGNICGVLNERVDKITCSGRDMREKPYLKGQDCVDHCYESSNFNRCGNAASENIYVNFLDTLSKEGKNLAILCSIGLGLSILSLAIFCYFVKIFVWSMVIVCLLAMFSLTGFLWYTYAQGAPGLIVVAVIFTIISLLLLSIVPFVATSINLGIIYFKHAVRIVFAMPLILLEPLMTILSNCGVAALFLYTMLLLSTAGRLQEKNTYHNTYDYVLDPAMSVALWLSIFMVIWMVQFVLACQHMVISGAVATCYFARDRISEVSPIYNSFFNLIRYHLGSVAFGSLIITLITILKIVMIALSRVRGWIRLVYMCFRPLVNLF